MLYLRSFNRFIFISLALLGCSISSVNAALVAPGQSAVFAFDTSTLGATTWTRFGYSTSACTPNTGSADCQLGNGNSFDLDFGIALGADDIGTAQFTNSSGQPITNADAPLSPNISIGATVTLLYVSLVYVNDSFDVESLYLTNAELEIYGALVDSPVSAVPVPAAVWLFGTALIGFIGMSRRRKVA